MDAALKSIDKYLSAINYDALAEWMSAEVVLSQPSDPLEFLRDVLTKKLDERGDAPYDAEHAAAYRAETYSDAVAKRQLAVGAGDEGDAEKPMTATEAAMRQRVERMEAALEAARRIACSLDPDSATETIVAECCTLLNADRASLFLMDEARNELKLRVADGADYIRVPVGEGIAGTVAATGRLENIPDAYEDARFSRVADENTGYVTRSILAAPVRNSEGKIVAVLQALNREGGPFDAQDEQLLGLFTAQAGVALQNALLFHRSQRAAARVHSVLELVRNMHNDLNVNSLMFTITQRAHELVDADRCTLFLADHKSQELHSLQGEVNIRIPIGKGIAGSVAEAGKAINISDAYQDERFNQKFDKETGYRTKSILCMPILGTDESVVGVIQLINKMESGLVTVFAEDDQEIMHFFLSLAGPILQTSQVFARAAADDDSVGDEFSGKVRKSPSKKRKEAAIIEEDDEEEEGDDGEGDEAEEDAAEEAASEGK